MIETFCFSATDCRYTFFHSAQTKTSTLKFSGNGRMKTILWDLAGFNHASHPANGIPQFSRGIPQFPQGFPHFMHVALTLCTASPLYSWCSLLYSWCPSLHSWFSSPYSWCFSPYLWCSSIYSRSPNLTPHAPPPYPRCSSPSSWRSSPYAWCSSAYLGVPPPTHSVPHLTLLTLLMVSLPSLMVFLTLGRTSWHTEHDEES
jgi:hypothetical protein